MCAPIAISDPGACHLNRCCSDPAKVLALNEDNGESRAPSKFSVGPVPASAVELSETRHESLKDKEDNSDRTPAKRPHGPPNPESKPVSTQPAST